MELTNNGAGEGEVAQVAVNVTTEALENHSTFWEKQIDLIHTLKTTDFRTQELPLARIKKIMKLDEDVKMISAEAPVLFAKAAEIFIAELSLRAWLHTEDNKRRTLQRNDIAMAITKYDQFDFLIDIVPRDELKPATKRQDSTSNTTATIPSDQVQYYLQLGQTQGTTIQVQNPQSLQTTATTQTIQANQLLNTTQPQVQFITVGNPGTTVSSGGQIQGIQVASSSNDNQSTSSTTQYIAAGGQTIPVQVPSGVQQLVTNSQGEVQQLQLTSQGLQFVRQSSGVTVQAGTQNQSLTPAQTQAGTQEFVTQIAGQQPIFQIHQIQGAEGQTHQVFTIPADVASSPADQQQ